jgi:hypothetical protein
MPQLRLDLAQRALDRAVELAPDDMPAAFQQLRVVSMRGDTRRCTRGSSRSSTASDSTR